MPKIMNALEIHVNEWRKIRYPFDTNDIKDLERIYKTKGSKELKEEAKQNEAV